MISLILIMDHNMFFKLHNWPKDHHMQLIDGKKSCHSDTINEIYTQQHDHSFYIKDGDI